MITVIRVCHFNDNISGLYVTMEVTKQGFYPLLFFWGAIWNFLAAGICWISAIFIPDIFFPLFDLPVPVTLFPYHSLFAFVFAFGIGYFLISRDVSKNHGIAWIGVFGKGAFFTICLLTYLGNSANAYLVLIGLVDLVFAVLFYRFLMKVRKVN